jgi:carnitine O-acetyltransferase
MRCFEVAGCPGGVRGDLVVQLALQLAYFTLTGRMDAVYQPVHMRRFKAGRTEAVRPVTRDTLAFCRLATAGAPHEAVVPLARRALRDIKARASRSRDGCGIDRHFFALYNLAARSGLGVGLFEDPAYLRLLGPAILCTSSVAAGSGLDRFAFGPVRPDGFGIAYVTDRASARFCVTGWRGDVDDFCRRVADAVGRVAQLAAARPAYLPAYLNE